MYRDVVSLRYASLRQNQPWDVGTIYGTRTLMHAACRTGGISKSAASLLPPLFPGAGPPPFEGPPALRGPPFFERKGSSSTCGAYGQHKPSGPMGQPMRLIPVSDSSHSWRNIKEQWKHEAETAGEDFSTFAIGTFAALDPLAAQDASKAGLFALYDGEKAHAICQVNRLLIKKYAKPVLRARFATVSPLYDFGMLDVSGYAEILVGLFSGVIWLSRNTLSADHIRFHLRSPGDAQFFAALRMTTPLSPFSQFEIRGAWVECTMK